MTVPRPAAARSRAARRSSRSIRRGAAGATVRGLPRFLRLTPCRRRHSPLGIRPAHALSTRANHPDRATTFHLPGDQPGSVMKARTAGYGRAEDEELTAQPAANRRRPAVLAPQPLSDGLKLPGMAAVYIS